MRVDTGAARYTAGFLNFEENCTNSRLQDSAEVCKRKVIQINSISSAQNVTSISMLNVSETLQAFHKIGICKSYIAPVWSKDMLLCKGNIDSTM